MADKTFKRQKAMEPIAADTLNQPIATVERIAKMSFESPLDATRMAGGTSVRVALPPEMDARITAVGDDGAYGWQGIFADADNPGEWLDLPTDISGTTTTDTLYERNGNSTLAVDTRVEIKRRMGVWLTSYDKCG